MKIRITENQLKNLKENLIQEGVREEFEDLFNFIANDPRKGGYATVYYTSPVSMNKGGRGGTEINPYYGRVFKDSAFSFRWEDTYSRAVERTNPDYEIGTRRGEFEKVQGYNVLETGKNGLYLPIIPLNLGKSTIGYRVANESGQLEPANIEDIKPYFKPPSNYQSASGVDYRLLMVDRISKIKAGGKDWNNPYYQYK